MLPLVSVSSVCRLSCVMLCGGEASWWASSSAAHVQRLLRGAHPSAIADCASAINAAGIISYVLINCDRCNIMCCWLPWRQWVMWCLWRGLPLWAPGPDEIALSGCCCIFQCFFFVVLLFTLFLFPSACRCCAWLRLQWRWSCLRSRTPPSPSPLSRLSSLPTLR